MEDKNPKVSIGLAVYNGEDYLSEAIESILNQTFTDFELIISDNASTDRTASICQRYAAQDARVRYHRNKTNIGGANNENLTMTMARGEYFRLAAHDDKLAPELLAQCVDVLDNHPEVVLCYTYIHEIDHTGRIRQTSSPRRGMATKPYRRFRELAFRDHFCEATYGLMRTAVLHQTDLQQNYTDSDRAFLCELALHGPFYVIPEPLFYKRYHQKNVYVDWRARMAWFNPKWKDTITFPNWLQFFDYLSTIYQSNISLYAKLRCYLIMVYWLLMNGKAMIKDLLVAASTILRIPIWSRKSEELYNWE